MGARGYGISLRVFNSQDESMRGITTKTNNGFGFQCTKFSVFVLVLTDRDLSNWVAPNLKWSIFVLSHKICHYPKQLNE